MNDALKMQISAFVDGELPENEAELLLRRLIQDVSMRQQVAEYLCIGRLLRRDAEFRGMDALRSRIASALGEEAHVAVQSALPERSRFFKPALGFAVAASVAVLAIVGLRQSVMPVVSETAALATDASDDMPLVAITQAPADDVLSEELRYMYRRHSASSADFGANGIITRLVTLELPGGELVQVKPENRPGNPVITDSAKEADNRLDDALSVGEMQAD